LYLRLPEELVEYKVFRAMIPGEAAHVRKAGDWVIVSFKKSLEDDDWDDGTGWMGSLMSLRAELLCGDIRRLYLDGYFAHRMKSLPRTNWSQRCLLVWANCPLPSIR
jgi:hypothetical protein